MKILSFLTILLSISNTFAQWSTDPNNNLVVAVGWDPHIASDSAGGCYITYNYGSFYPQKLAVERLDKYGYKPWGTRRQILGELPEQWQAQIIEDGEGGVIVSYEDNQVVGANYITRVRVQKVDSNGNFLWGQTGVRVTLEEVTHGAQKLVSDGDGGCVVLWQDNLANYRINRIEKNGQRVWGDTGILIGNGVGLIIRASDGNYYVQVYPDIFRINQNGEILNQYSTTLVLSVADPEGGVVLSTVVGNISNRRLVAQRKDSLGNNLWQEPYVEIADSLYINTRPSLQHKNGYYYLGWVGAKNGAARVAQFQALRLDGTKLFPNGSIKVGEPPLIGETVLPLDTNKTAFIYYNKDFLPDSLLVQAYDTLGNKIWTENVVVIAHPPIEYQSYTTDGNGGFIIGGVIDNFTVVAQQVNKYGNLGEIITYVYAEEINIVPKEINLYQNYPNPFNSSTIIRYDIPIAETVRINLYNILGEKILTLVEGEQSSGYHEIILSSDGLSSGVYFYSLETASSRQTNKLTIIK